MIILNTQTQVRESNSVAAGAKILAGMKKLKANSLDRREGSYRCHNVSPYGDGYGDSQYGDSTD